MPRSLRLAPRTVSIIVSLLLQYALILSVTGLAGMRVTYGQASSQSPPVRTRSEELPKEKAANAEDHSLTKDETLRMPNQEQELRRGRESHQRSGADVHLRCHGATGNG